MISEDDVRRLALELPAHYAGHPIVLVRLDAVDLDEAEELIIESWRQRAPKPVVRRWDSEHE